MKTTDFLKIELLEHQSAIRKIALDFDNIVQRLCKVGYKEQDAIIQVETMKRELISRRDFLNQLIYKAEETEE